MCLRHEIRRIVSEPFVICLQALALHMGLSVGIVEGTVVIPVLHQTSNWTPSIAPSAKNLKPALHERQVRDK